MAWHLICSEKILDENSIKGLSIDVGEKVPLALLIFRQDSLIYAYKNHCPHLGIPLNWQPDAFLSLDETHIQCSTHGALFTFEHGHCIAGPCAGQALTVLTIEQRGNEIWLNDDT